MGTPRLGMSARGIDSFYSLLWKKDELGQGAPGISVPDTIVFRKQSTPQWYFTSVQEKTILRKSSKNTTPNNMFEVFCKKPSKMEPGRLPCDIVASYISDEVGADGQRVAAIEYFDEEGLRNFLFSRVGAHLRDGILQKFVEPSGLSNSVIRAIWTPKVCMIERRINTKRLSDRKYDCFTRSVTYEGDEHLSAFSPVTATTLTTQIEKSCDAIAQHLNKCLPGLMITKLVLNFKLDYHDRLWVLWCSALKTVKNTLSKTPSENQLQRFMAAPPTSRDSQPQPSSRPPSRPTTTTLLNPQSQVSSSGCGGVGAGVVISVGGGGGSGVMSGRGPSPDRPSSSRLSARGGGGKIVQRPFKCPSCKKSYDDPTCYDVMYRTAILRFLKTFAPKLPTKTSTSPFESVFEDNEAQSKGAAPSAVQARSSPSLFESYATNAGVRAVVSKPLIGRTTLDRQISDNSAMDQIMSLDLDNVSPLKKSGSSYLGSGGAGAGVGTSGYLMAPIANPASSGGVGVGQRPGSSGWAGLAEVISVDSAEAELLENWKTGLYRRFFRLRPGSSASRGERQSARGKTPDIAGKFHADFEQEKSEDAVPPILKIVEPGLTQDKYIQSKQDPLFLYKTFQVCEECGLAFMKNAEEDSIFMAKLSDELQGQTVRSPRKFRLSKRIEELAQNRFQKSKSKNGSLTDRTTSDAEGHQLIPAPPPPPSTSNRKSRPSTVPNLRRLLTTPRAVNSAPTTFRRPLEEGENQMMDKDFLSSERPEREGKQHQQQQQPRVGISTKGVTIRALDLSAIGNGSGFDGPSFDDEQEEEQEEGEGEGGDVVLCPLESLEGNNFKKFLSSLHDTISQSAPSETLAIHSARNSRDSLRNKHTARPPPMSARNAKAPRPHPPPAHPHPPPRRGFSVDRAVASANRRQTRYAQQVQQRGASVVNSLLHSPSYQEPYASVLAEVETRSQKHRALGTPRSARDVPLSDYTGPQFDHMSLLLSPRPNYDEDENGDFRMHRVDSASTNAAPVIPLGSRPRTSDTTQSDAVSMATSSGMLLFGPNTVLRSRRPPPRLRAESGPVVSFLPEINTSSRSASSASVFTASSVLAPPTRHIIPPFVDSGDDDLLDGDFLDMELLSSAILAGGPGADAQIREVESSGEESELSVDDGESC